MIKNGHTWEMNNALPSAPHLLFLCCSALAPLSFLLLFPFIHILLTLFLAPLFLSLFTASLPLFHCLYSPSFPPSTTPYCPLPCSTVLTFPPSFLPLLCPPLPSSTMPFLYLFSLQNFPESSSFPSFYTGSSISLLQSLRGMRRVAEWLWHLTLFWCAIG